MRRAYVSDVRLLTLQFYFVVFFVDNVLCRLLNVDMCKLVRHSYCLIYICVVPE